MKRLLTSSSTRVRAGAGRLARRYKERVVLVGDEQGGHRVRRAGTIQALPTAASGQQPVWLARILQDRGCALAAQELHQLAPEAHHLAKTALPPLTRDTSWSKRRSVPAAGEARISNGADTRGRTTQNNGVLELALERG